MRRWVKNVFRLGVKELISLSRDTVMMVLIVYFFTVVVYVEATATKTDVSNATVAVVDADQSMLSSRIKDALLPPYFRTPVEVDRAAVDQRMDKGQSTFVLDIPPRLEADLLAGRGPSIQIDVDATAVAQADVGTAYLREIIAEETASFLKDRSAQILPVTPVIRALFNPNLDAERFNAVMGVIDDITILSIILVGAAVMRERERGTIEHLLVMPIRPSEIAAGKIWANGLVIIIAAAFALHVVVQLVLGVPLVGSAELFLAGTAAYLFALTSLGILLATIVNSMPQFTLLAIPVFVVMILLSGVFTPFESMPVPLQYIMYASPSTHFVRLAQAVLYRGAGMEVVWVDFAFLAGLGAAFLTAALARFRAMLAQQA